MLLVKGYVEHAGLVSSAQFALQEGSPARAQDPGLERIGRVLLRLANAGTEGAASFCTQAAGEQS